MIAKYIRVSTFEQNLSRQRTLDKADILYEDKISGIIPFQERPAGKRLTNDILSGKVNHVIIESIDRLGRNILEIQQQLHWLISHKVQLFVKNIQLYLLNDDGSINMITKMIIDLLGSVASLEIENIKYRQQQGIAIAKTKGVYKGRQLGAIISKENYAKRHKDIISLLKDGLSYYKVSKLTGKAYVTVKKVAFKMDLAY